ncbi:hypothetical protein D3C76_1631510 [compost metagenome]
MQRIAAAYGQLADRFDPVEVQLHTHRNLGSVIPQGPGEQGLRFAPQVLLDLGGHAQALRLRGTAVAAAEQ